MTLKEKIGQLFVMGFRGPDAGLDSVIHREINELGIGGVILFDKDMVYHRPVNNIESPGQIKSLTETLKSYAKTPLLIGIDQEGGLINRLKPEYGFPETRSHFTLGSLDDVKETEAEGAKIAGMLKEAGINLNFAPVVDMVTDRENSPIGKRERSFGSTADLVNRQAAAYISGHRSHGVLTCCKHFPGLGSATGDTHFGFVDVTGSWDLAETRPYEYLIAEEQCDMVMTTHVFNKHFDEKYPATLSENTIQNYLRRQLGYNGVVISDDMQMQAISDHFSLKEALKFGLMAGLDLFCFGNNLLQEQIRADRLITAVYELVNDGIISETRIDESVERILKLKESIS